MREAYHVLEKKIESLPLKLTGQNVRHYKQLAIKGVYICPYCEAQLIVKYGEMREIHFSHKQSEACLESRTAEKAEKKYRNQTVRESEAHKTFVDIFIDELNVASKTNRNVRVDYGYRAKKELNYFPDIWLKINNNEIAMSVVTNVSANEDPTLAKDIKKRHKYFIENGMHPVWFIESKELAIEKEKQSIVLWEVEESIALKTKEDKKWEEDLKTIATDLSFFNLYNYTPSMHRLNINVQSLYYVHSSDGGISISIYRFLKDRSIKPFRAFLLGEGYDIPFSKALVINEGRLNLSNPIIDKKNREDFIAHYNSLVKQHQENERIKKEYEEQQRRELSKKKHVEQQQRNERDRNRALEEKIKKQKREEMQKNLNTLLEKAKDYLANIPFENYSEAQLWSKQSMFISDFKIKYMKGKYLNIDIDKFTFKMEQLIAEQFVAKQPLRKVKQQKLKEEMLAIVEKEFNKKSLDYLKKNTLATDPYISIPLFENMLTKLSNYAKKANWKFRVTDWIDRSDIGQCLINIINEREKTEGQELRRKLEQEQLEKNRLCDEIKDMQQVEGVQLVENVDELRNSDFKKIKEQHKFVLKLYEKKTRLSLF